MKTITRLYVLAGIVSVTAAAQASPADYLKRPTDWFKSSQGITVLSNVLSWQSALGDWPKNMDTSLHPNTNTTQKISGTFDNGATRDELRLLARAYAVTRERAYQDSFLTGLNHILAAQYPNGGWPQTYPPGKGYPRHITYNDNTMIGIMEFLREVASDPSYDFLATELRQKCRTAFDRGIECVLNCQVKVDGKLTVWCAQHDERTLEPRGARSYELPSLSGSESAGVLKLLMSLENPGERVCRAIEAGAAWFQANPVRGTRLERKDGDRVTVADPNAPDLWARFYEIETMRPFYCDRDGVKKYDYNRIGAERRNGYAWLGTWGRDVESAYAKWLQMREPRR